MAVGKKQNAAVYDLSPFVDKRTITSVMSLRLIPLQYFWAT